MQRFMLLKQMHGQHCQECITLLAVFTNSLGHVPLCTDSEY